MREGLGGEGGSRLQIPDLWQHEVVDAAGVLLLHRLGVDEVAHVLVHHLRDEGREGSLRTEERAERKEWRERIRTIPDG